jgi:hypothetical protein
LQRLFDCLHDSPKVVIQLLIAKPDHEEPLRGEPRRAPAIVILRRPI